MKKGKKPYDERSDLEKIQSNWNKVNGLFNSEQWSSAVTRAATAAEIAANLAVREELVKKRGLDKDFVDHLLIWANGLQGKFTKLIVPISKGAAYHDSLKKLQSNINEINRERNAVVHRGEFKKKSTTHRIIEESQTVIETLVGIYHKNFELPVIKGSTLSGKRRSRRRS
jgi:hypothetical protein